jgi:hypothetical protein
MSDSYILNNDKIENFECKLQLEGASLTKSIARIILECGEHTLLYNGTISSDGVCKVSISKLNKLFTEEVRGKIKLEVIAEGTYFSPWEDSLIIKPSKSVTVESIKINTVVNKPKVEILKKVSPVITETKVEKASPDINELVEIIKQQRITKQMVFENVKAMTPILRKTIESYFESFDQKPSKNILKDIINKL